MIRPKTPGMGTHILAVSAKPMQPAKSITNRAVAVHFIDRFADSILLAFVKVTFDKDDLSAAKRLGKFGTVLECHLATEAVGIVGRPVVGQMPGFVFAVELHNSLEPRVALRVVVISLFGILLGTHLLDVFRTNNSLRFG